MSTIILSLVFLVMWGATAFLFWVERAARIKAELSFNQAREDLLQATRVIKAVTVITRRASKLNEPEFVEGNIRSFVEAAKELDVSGHQKRQQVLLAFLKAHPGTSVSAAELAIEKVLNSGG